jgi:hypothetical protein
MICLLDDSENSLKEMKSNLILPEDVQPYTADETLVTCPTLGCFRLLLSMPALLSYGYGYHYLSEVFSGSWFCKSQEVSDVTNQIVSTTKCSAAHE